MAKINSTDLPLFIRTATRSELIKMMDIFTVAINDLDSRIGLKEGDTTEIHQTLTQLNNTLSGLDALVSTLSAGVNSNLGTIQALQSVNRQIYKLSDDQLEELKGISLDAIATLFDRFGYYIDAENNIIESVVGDPKLTAEKGEATGVIDYIQDLNTLLLSVQSKAIANEAALPNKADANHNHDGVYKADSYVPSYSEITGVPLEFTPIAHNHNADYYTKVETTSLLSGKSDVHAHPYRENTWVPGWGDIQNIPSLDWAKVFADSGNAQIPASYIPDKPPTVMYTVSDSAAMLALTGVNQGDYCTLTTPDPDEVYIALVNNPSGIGDWLEFSPGVESVDGRIGTVTLTDLYAPITGSANYKPSGYVPSWAEITGKPSEFTPVAHNHNDLYYSEAEVDTFLSAKADNHTHPYRPDDWVPGWSDVTNKPTFNWAKVYGDSGNTKIPEAYLPSIAIVDSYPVATEAAQLALDVQKGDIAIRSDIRKTYIALNSTNASMGDWRELATPTDTVTSVDGQTGAVTLNAVSHDDFGINGILKRVGIGAYSVVSDNSENWNVAYGWGNHADVNYIEDADFESNGILVRNGAGDYAVILDKTASWDLGYAHSLVDHAPVTADKTSENETSHADVLVDGDFNEAGFMITDGEGNYSIGTETFLTEAGYRTTELTGLNFATEILNVVATDNILEAVGKMEYRIGLNDTKPDANDIDWDYVFGKSGNTAIPTQYLPALAITSTYVSASEVAQLALTVQEGDVCVRSDLNKSYVALNGDNANMADWQELYTPTDLVLSVDGLVGAVNLSGKYEALGAVDTHEEAWNHNDFLTTLSFDELTDKPTTLGGYGITDAAAKLLTGYTIAGAKENLAGSDTVLAAFGKLEHRVAINDLKNTADGSAAVQSHESTYDHDEFATNLAISDALSAHNSSYNHSNYLNLGANYTVLGTPEPGRFLIQEEDNVLRWAKEIWAFSNEYILDERLYFSGLNYTGVYYYTEETFTPSFDIGQGPGKIDNMVVNGGSLNFSLPRHINGNPFTTDLDAMLTTITISWTDGTAASTQSVNYSAVGNGTEAGVGHRVMISSTGQVTISLVVCKTGGSFDESAYHTNYCKMTAKLFQY